MVGVGDLDVFVDAGDDDGLVPVAVVFLLAIEDVVLPAPDDGDVPTTVRLGPKDERLVEGELEPPRLPVTEREADFVDEA